LRLSKGNRARPGLIRAKEENGMSQVLYDTVIIGGGPAGAAAAVYAARKKMKTLGYL
jgi:alkyl hydroperoxide reductase subunit AhpF